MKRAITLALVVLLSVTAFAQQNATGGNPEGMFIAYASVPNGWENPCVWAWDEAGNNAFSAWPGGEAEADPNNAGWYYCYLPNWANNIIINANGGTVQTDAFKVEGQRNFWVTVRAPDRADISFNALTVGQAPDYVEKTTVHAKVPAGWENPCLWAWSHPDGTNAFTAWPGGGMAGASGEWYSTKAPVWINSIIINANGGSVQTADLKDLEHGRDIWVVVENDRSAKVYYENPDLMVPNITVRAKVPASWEGPCLWAWLHPEGTSIFASWPGQPFARNGEWYEISLPGWVNSFIVNANGGSVQTGDIKELDAGKDLWIIVTDAENYTYHYEYAGAVTQPAASTSRPTVWIVLATALVAAIVAICAVAVNAKKKKK